MSAVAGILTPLFFPMDRREVMAAGQETLRGSLHIPATGVGALFFLLAMGFGATLHGKRFRFYSFATIAIVLVLGAWAGLDASKIAANEPTPWHGIKERINIYTYLLWVVVLAISLWRVQGAVAPEEGRPTQTVQR